MVYAELNNDVLTNWILHQDNYDGYVKNTILKIMKQINVSRNYNKRILVKVMYTFIHNHKKWLNLDINKTFKKMVIHKLIDWSEEAPEYAELYHLYIKLL